jgi:hypothetical protein
VRYVLVPHRRTNLCYLLCRSKPVKPCHQRCVETCSHEQPARRHPRGLGGSRSRSEVCAWGTRRGRCVNGWRLAIGAVLLLLVVRLLQGGGRSFCFCLWFGFYKVVAVSETGADADGGSGRAWRHRLPQRKQCLNSAKQCSPGLTSPGSKTRKWHRSIDRIPVRAINHHCR